MEEADWQRIYHSDLSQSQLSWEQSRDYQATHAIVARWDVDKTIIRIIIPVLTESYRVPAQEHLQLLAGATWPVGDFETSFPELARYTNGVESILLEEVRQILDNDQKRTGGPLEVFGLKIPSTVLNTWGLMLLLGLTIYFALHVNAFSKSAAVRGPWAMFPWIGLYPDLPSRLAYVISVIGLPVGASVMLIIPNFDGASIFQQALQCAIIVVTTVLCAFSAWRTFRLTLAVSNS